MYINQTQKNTKKQVKTSNYRTQDQRVQSRNQGCSHKVKLGLIIFASIVAVTIITILIICATTYNNDNSNSSQQSTSQSNDSNNTGTDENSDPKKVNQYEGEDPNNSSELTGSISSAFIANGQFSLRVMIDQYISNGTCSLNMTKGDKVFTKTVPLIADVSSSTCQGFDASETEVSAGTWHIVIELQSDNKKGKIESEVNL